MSFEDYAYVEHTQAIRDKQGSPLAVTLSYTDADLLKLFQINQNDLLRHPSVAMDESTRSSAEVFADRNISNNDKIQVVSPVVTANVGAGLVAAYSSLGQAYVSGMQIVLSIKADFSLASGLKPKNGMAIVESDSFLGFEENVLVGAQKFFGEIYEVFGRPAKVNILAFAKPGGAIPG